ncbi:MAG: glutathionylspermidine synthase family protein [Bradymonadaceae bacterium]
MRTMAWPMEPYEVVEVFKAIQFAHFKWDIFHRGDSSILPEALVLTAGEHQKLVEAAEGVWAGLREVEAVVRRDADLLDAVAVPATLTQAIVEQRDDHPRVTRCDFHLTTDGGWMISEFNDDVPSGYAECTGLAAVLMEDWSERFEGLEFKGDLRGQTLDSLKPWSSIGLVHATAYSEDLQHVALVEEWLKKVGHTTILGSPANLSVEGEQTYLFDTPIDALFRYFPGEWIGDLPNFEDWSRAARTLPMMNPLSALASQSKRFYATWSEHEIPLSEEASGWLDAHIPPSRYLGSMSKEEVFSNPEKWVLKGAFGRMGNTVRIGPLLSEADWKKAVDEAFDVPRVVVAQERFETAALWTSKGLGYATVGVYLVDGRFAGYFSRIDKGPLIDYDSWHVPTLVEIS